MLRFLKVRTFGSKSSENKTEIYNKNYYFLEELVFSNISGISRIILENKTNSYNRKVT